MRIQKRFEGELLLLSSMQETSETDQSEQGGLPVTHQNQSPSPPKTVTP